MNIFKKKVPETILFELLDKVAIREDNFYILNKSIFKSIQINNYLIPFYEKCSEYYKSKQSKYLNPPHTYKTFLTVIRQLCNINNIYFHYKIKYIHSKYEIIYYISQYLPSNPEGITHDPIPDGTFQNEIQFEGS